MKFTVKEYFTLQILTPDLLNLFEAGNTSTQTSTALSLDTYGTVPTDWKTTSTAQALVSAYIPAFNNLKEDINDKMYDTEFTNKVEQSKEFKNVTSLLLPILINTNAEIANINHSIYIADKASKSIDGASLIKLNKPNTLADYKVWADAGLYNPREDMMKLYGFNPAPTYTNYYINNGVEANQFAKVYFNRLFGESFVNSISYIGRPEVFLNRPYFLEKKDCIGLLSTYSLKLS